MATKAGRYDEVLLGTRGTSTSLYVLNADDVQVEVFESDGTTNATLYDDRDKTAYSGTGSIVEPDDAGNLEFFADPGTYVLEVSKGDTVLRSDTVVVAPDPVEVVGGVVPSGGSSGDLVVINDEGDGYDVVGSGTYERKTMLDVRDYGAVLDGSTNDHAAILAAIADLPGGVGKVVIAGGTAAIDAEIPLTHNQGVEVAADAGVQVPNGYTGNVFALQGKRITIDGHGTINEAGSAQHLWTAFHFDATSGASVNQCSVGELYVDSPGVLFKLSETDAGGYVSGNLIRGTRARHPYVCWDFVQTTPANHNLLSRLTSVGVDIQADNVNTTHVLRNLTGIGHTFVGCRIFDANAAATEIAANAQGTLIVGGMGMTRWGWSDSGNNTRVMDVDRDSFEKVGRYFKGFGGFAIQSNATVGVINNVSCMLLADGTTSIVGGSFELPAGTYDLVAHWAPAGTAAGDANIRVDYDVHAVGDTMARTVGSTTNSTSPGVQGQIVSTTMAQVTVADGETLNVTFLRAGGTPTDTLTDSIGFLGIDPVAV